MNRKYTPYRPDWINTEFKDYRNWNRHLKQLRANRSHPSEFITIEPLTK